MIFTRCPGVLKPFLAPLRRVLSRAEFAHLWGLLVAWLLTARPGKLVHLAGRPARRHRTRLGAFLGSDGWDAADLLDVQALRLLLRLRPCRGHVVHLLIDDTRVAKRGKK